VAFRNFAQTATLFLGLWAIRQLVLNYTNQNNATHCALPQNLETLPNIFILPYTNYQPVET
jgi:hypothetical protein